ncbi:hypothetical protein [Halostella salina]|uniref:hypothetical protein n=1 Tax=Halostella salina TaxID=1547897 RepID=UPI000EF76EFE|nr:hypothetical protein [Halostella salina]
MRSADPSRLTDSLRGVTESLPWRSLLVDLLVVAVWVLAASVAFRAMEWPVLPYYAVVFGGVVAYSLADRPFGR